MSAEAQKNGLKRRKTAYATDIGAERLQIIEFADKLHPAVAAARPFRPLKLRVGGNPNLQPERLQQHGRSGH